MIPRNENKIILIILMISYIPYLIGMYYNISESTDILVEGMDGFNYLIYEGRDFVNWIIQILIYESGFFVLKYLKKNIEVTFVTYSYYLIVLGILPIIKNFFIWPLFKFILPWSEIVVVSNLLSMRYAYTLGLELVCIYIFSSYVSRKNHLD